MNDSLIDILDLSDEILLLIFSKLKKIDVLYSLIGVNIRLDKIACDNLFTQSIDLTVTSPNNKNVLLSDSMLSRFCLDIFPRIHRNVQCLTLEPFFMERIFHASDYPNLYKLILVELNLEQALYHFNDDSPFAHIFKKQISHLEVTIVDDTDTVPLMEVADDIYGRIFAFFTNVTHLDFGISNISRHLPLLIGYFPSNICFSSSILHLSIGVLSSEDCLHLLDGRLPQLHTLIVTVLFFNDHSFNRIDNTQKELHNLKCFSLKSRSKLTTYDNQIVPLLRRMFQLEKLTLSLDVHNRTTFIEGTHLNNTILSQMSHLQTFIFNIVTWCSINHEDQKSAHDIQCTFVQQIGCYVDYFLDQNTRCHIYSLPFTMDYFHDITNNFPGGLFTSVRTLSIRDYMRSFEYDFFQRISHSFPLLHHLNVFNTTKQNEKSTRQSYVSEQTSSIIEFSHLSQLNLRYAHVDYAEQFLLQTHTHLPCLNELEISFEHLQNVTENFTNHIARGNCAKVKRLLLTETIVHSNDFYLYFPLL